MIKLPEEFINRMKAQLGNEFDAFMASYNEPYKRGLCVNTQKISVESLKSRLSGYKLTPSGIIDEGFIADGEGIGIHPYHMAGAYYMQEPSAMSVLGTLNDIDLSDDLRILDLCAAPGGKTVTIANRMHGRGIIVANEVVRSRANELVKNVERMGITNAVVTNLMPNKIADSLPEYFDIVVVDAPCSGEGMFRKNPSAVDEWSIEHVKSCANRQRAILTDAIKCLAPNGILVYSTCTFSPDENEETVEFIKNQFGLEVEKSHKLYPHSSVGEGHFACRMRLNQDGMRRNIKLTIPKPCNDKFYTEFIKECFITPPTGKPITVGNNVIIANDEMYTLSNMLNAISFGTDAGEIARGYFKPSHGLFTSCHDGVFRNVIDYACDSDELADYLRGEELPNPTATKDGYCMITADGIGIGHAKITGDRLKNKLPKGLRNKARVV